MAGQPLPSFDLSMLGEAVSQPSEGGAEAATGVPDEEQPDAAVRREAPELDQALAGQWLQGALEQRGAVVEVRGQARGERDLDALRTLERLTSGGDSARLFALPPALAGAPLAADGQAVADSLLSAANAQRAGAAPLPGGTLELAPVMTSAAGGQAHGAATIEQTLKLGAAEPKWGEQMLNAVRKSIDVQIRQGVQNASIRLDPPELGRLDISVTNENGRLSIQISAANGDVARLLHQTSERLRQELVAENFVHVDVQVASDNQQGREGQSQPRTVSAFGDSVIGVNGGENAVDSGTRSRQAASDVLVTV